MHIYLEKGQINFSFLGWGLKVTYNSDIFEKWVFKCLNLNFRHFCSVFCPILIMRPPLIDTVCSAKLELDLAWQYPDKNINNYRATNNIFYLCVCVGSHVRILYHCKQYPILLITIEQQILFILFYLFVCMCGFAFHV